MSFSADPTYSCTLEIFGANLKDCCNSLNIEFTNHHDALADAEACAKLYLSYFENNSKVFIPKNDEPFAAKRIEKSDLQPDFDIENKNNPFFKKRVIFACDLVTFSRKEAAHRIKLIGAD